MVFWVFLLILHGVLSLFITYENLIKYFLFKILINIEHRGSFIFGSWGRNLGDGEYGISQFCALWLSTYEMKTGRHQCLLGKSRGLNTKTKHKNIYFLILKTNE